MLARRIYIVVSVLLLLALAGELALYWYHERQPSEYPCDQFIPEVARDAGIDPFLVRAVIWRESRFLPLTHGAADERGLMQVQPEVGQMWAKTNKIVDYKDDDLYDPLTNIRVGSWYLNRAIKRWNQAQADDPVPFALAEYNAGRTNALKWVDPDNPRNHEDFVNRITFPTTRKYVDDIMKQRDYYRVRLAANPWYRDFAGPNPAVTAAP